MLYPETLWWASISHQTIQLEHFVNMRDYLPYFSTIFLELNLENTSIRSFVGQVIVVMKEGYSLIL